MNCIAWVPLVLVTLIAVTSAAPLPPAPKVEWRLDRLYRNPGSTPQPSSYVTPSLAANLTTISQMVTTASPTTEPYTPSLSSTSNLVRGVLIGCCVIIVYIAFSICIAIYDMKERGMRVEDNTNTQDNELTVYSQTQTIDDENQLNSTPNDNAVTDENNDEFQTGDKSNQQTPPVHRNSDQPQTAAGSNPQPPTAIESGQQLPTAIVSGQQLPTAIVSGQQLPTAMS